TTTNANAFYNLSHSGADANGTATVGTVLTVTNNLTLATGNLDSSGFNWTLGNVLMTGGRMNTTGIPNVTLSGNMNISSTSSAIRFGASVWTVAGSWTNASTNSGSWN